MIVLGKYIENCVERRVTFDTSADNDRNSNDFTIINQIK